MPINYNRDKQRFRYTYGAASRMQQKNYALLRVEPKFVSSTVFTPWTPPLDNLFAWYDPSYGVTIVSGTVQYWLDRVGIDPLHALTQSTPSRQPSFIASTASFNNHPVIAFTSSTDKMGSADWFPNVLNTPQTYYVVCQVLALNQSLGAAYVLVDGINGNNILGPSVPNNNKLTVNGVNTPFYVTGSSIICAICDGTSSAVSVNTLTPFSFSTTTFSHRAVKLDTFYSDIFGESSANIIYAEILMYSGSHSNLQRAAITQGLAEKYGITLA
jgi:hypothetical protein